MAITELTKGSNIMNNAMEFEEADKIEFREVLKNVKITLTNLQREQRLYEGNVVAQAGEGKLILMMSLKNEEENLRKSLPEWAKIVDAYVLGIDVTNSDDSEAVIKEHLGHLPGVIIPVEFSGLGIIFSQLAMMASLKFPEMHFCLRADASFYPSVDTFHREELNPAYLKANFNVITDGTVNKTIDYVFRNLPSARWIGHFHERIRFEMPPEKRDTYQFSTSLNFTVAESAAAGHSARLGSITRHNRYIEHLRIDVSTGIDLISNGLWYIALEQCQKSSERGNVSVMESTVAQRDDLQKCIKYYRQYFELEKIDLFKHYVDGYSAVMGYITMGHAYFKLGQPENAVKKYEDAAERDRRLHNGRNNFADANFYAGRTLQWSLWTVNRNKSASYKATILNRAIDHFRLAESVPLPVNFGSFQYYIPVYTCHAKLALAAAIRKCITMEHCECESCTAANLHELALKMKRQHTPKSCKFSNVEDLQYTDDVLELVRTILLDEAKRVRKKGGGEQNCDLKDLSLLNWGKRAKLLSEEDYKQFEEVVKESEIDVETWNALVNNEEDMNQLFQPVHLARKLTRLWKKDFGEKGCKW
eukprot:g4515.t1